MHFRLGHADTTPLFCSLPMPLEPHDARHLRAAQGYLERGLYLEANAELEEIDFDVRHLPEVLTVRLDIYHALEKWDLMEVVARRLVRYDENDVRATVLWATATRHADCLAAAQVILLEAVERIPDSAALHYKLAAMEAQLGEIGTAKARLRHAITLAASLRLCALEDKDLEPLWDSLR